MRRKILEVVSWGVHKQQRKVIELFTQTSCAIYSFKITIYLHISVFPLTTCGKSISALRFRDNPVSVSSLIKTYLPQQSHIQTCSKKFYMRNDPLILKKNGYGSFQLHIKLHLSRVWGILGTFIKFITTFARRKLSVFQIFVSKTTIEILFSSTNVFGKVYDIPNVCSRSILPCS